jgi:DNA-binding NarL/FixJ family response regulator
MMRALIRTLCQEIPDCEIAADVGTGQEAIECIVRTLPDVVVLDLGLPDFDGLEVIRRIHAHGQWPRILVLSGYANPYIVYRLEQERISGFVDKRSNTLVSLRRALAAVRSSRTYFSETYLKGRFDRCRDPHSFDKLLTNQQLLVLSMVAHLLDDDAIASLLDVSARTVEAHRTAIMRKLCIHSRTQLIRFAREQGLMWASLAQHTHRDPRVIEPEVSWQLSEV